MANIRKQFNFRNGVQVDDDKLIVSPTGLVGIGTSVPTESLDVHGNVKVTGLTSTTSLFTPSLEATSATIENITLDPAGSIVGGGVSIVAGVVTSASAGGIVTYYGDARYLDGMPGSQWIDIDAGLGYTSIYAQGNVGVGTVDPRFTFQVSGSPSTAVGIFTGGVGISSVGNMIVTGIVTAHRYVGMGSELFLLNASAVGLGTLTLDRLPLIPDYKLEDGQSLGIVTTTVLDATGAEVGVATITDLTVEGTLTGTASTAQGLTGVPNIVVGILTATNVAASSFVGGITGDVAGTASTARNLTTDAGVDILDMTVGVATITTKAVVDGNLGVGTDIPLEKFVVHNVPGTGQLNAQIISDDSQSQLSIGSSIDVGGYSGALRYNSIVGAFTYSGQDHFDILNYGPGNLNFYLDANNSVAVPGNFFWHNGPTNHLMALTYDGKLGIGVTNPEASLEVAGISSASNLWATNNINAGGNLTLDGNIVAVGAGATVTANTLYLLGGTLNDVLKDQNGDPLFGVGANLDITSGISTFNDVQVNRDLYLDNSTDANGYSGGIYIGDIENYTKAGAPLQVGDWDPTEEEEAEGVVVIEEGSIGIGTTAARGAIALDVFEGDAIFNGVGIGTIDVEGDAVLQVYGPIHSHRSPEFPNDDPGCIFQGITTSTGGFSSGNGVIEISVVGNNLTFTVPGVGTTTLTLF